MSTATSEYAQAGVDYTKIEPFKRAMIRTGARTLEFPKRRFVNVEIGEHGALFDYYGGLKHRWGQTQEASATRTGSLSGCTRTPVPAGPTTKA